MHRIIVAALLGFSGPVCQRPLRTTATPSELHFCASSARAQPLLLPRLLATSIGIASTERLSHNPT